MPDNNDFLFNNLFSYRWIRLIDHSDGQIGEKGHTRNSKHDRCNKYRWKKKKSKWRWWGHVTRDEDRWISLSISWKLDGKRALRRPRIWWSDEILKFWENWQEEVQDCGVWNNWERPSSSNGLIMGNEEEGICVGVCAMTVINVVQVYKKKYRSLPLRGWWILKLCKCQLHKHYKFIAIVINV